jgi:hypothetical protein
LPKYFGGIKSTSQTIGKRMDDFSWRIYKGEINKSAESRKESSDNTALHKSVHVGMKLVVSWCLSCGYVVSSAPVRANFAPVQTHAFNRNEGNS